MAKRKKEAITLDKILDLYMDYVVEQGMQRSVYEFCIASDISENDFYDHLGSMEDAEKTVWKQLMHSSVVTTTSDESFAEFDRRDQLLSLYYTFFQNCLLNRAYLMTSIEHHGATKMLPVLCSMKDVFAIFIKDTMGGSAKILEQAPIDLNKIIDKATIEGFWAQFLFLLDFWRRDTSEQCEKTDIAIEKAVKASMDLIDTTPIKSVFDFAKFIWHERFSKI
jgi:hypothetical protein